MGIEVTILPPSLDDKRGDNLEERLDRLHSRIEQWTNGTLSVLDGDGWETIHRGRHVKFAHPEVSSVSQAEERLRSLGIDPGPCVIREFKYAKGTPNLKRAFKRMRKEGLVAKQDYYYFPSDGFAAMAKVADARHRAGKTLTAYAFYHGQAADNLHDGHDFPLYYGAHHTSPRPIDEYTARIAAGRIACECLRSEGVECEWDEDPDKVIMVRTRSVEFTR